jgi:hypothetical protein
VRAHEEAPRKLRQCLEAEGANVFTTEMLGTVAGDLAELDRAGDDLLFPGLDGLSRWVARYYAPRREGSGAVAPLPPAYWATFAK